MVDGGARNERKHTVDRAESWNEARVVSRPSAQVFIRFKESERRTIYQNNPAKTVHRGIHILVSQTKKRSGRVTKF